MTALAPDGWCGWPEDHEPHMEGAGPCPGVQEAVVRRERGHRTGVLLPWPSAGRLAAYLDESGDELLLVSGWVVAANTECTCSPHYGTHEPYCGPEPIMPAAEWMSFQMPAARSDDTGGTKP